MNRDQNIRYIMEASKAFAAIYGHGPGSAEREVFKQFRDSEKLWATCPEPVEGSEPKSFPDFSEMDLTRCLIHFRHLQKGVRLTFDEITRLAQKRQPSDKMEMLQSLWDAIESGPRGTVMKSRFGIMFFEQIEQLDEKEFRNVEITLHRLAREYPLSAEASRAKAERKETTCPTL